MIHIKEFIKELTTKQLLIRLIAYPFSLLLIGVGISMIITEEEEITGIGAVIVAILYLWTDIKIIHNKRKERTHNKPS